MSIAVLSGSIRDIVVLFFAVARLQIHMIKIKSYSISKVILFYSIVCRFFPEGSTSSRSGGSSSSDNNGLNHHQVTK